MANRKLGAVALGKVHQSLPTSASDIAAVSSRVSVLEGQNLNYRTGVLETKAIDLEARLADLESRLANYENHTHTYEDDNGTTISSKTTSSAI